MKHKTNTFGKWGKTLPLYGFAVLILAALLLCAGSQKDISNILSNLDYLVSILLKAALTYFFFEAASFLRRHQKQSLRRPIKRRDNVIKDTTSTTAEPFNDNMNSISIQPASMPQARQAEETKLLDSSPRKNVPTTTESVCGQVEERIPVPQPICLDFQDTMRALDIMDGKRQGPICFIPTHKGPLVGIRNEKGSYSVSLNEEYLTEAELRYSPVATCFEITGLAHVRQKAKVRCDRPAILTEIEDGLYEIAEKGQLTVVSIIE